MESGHNWTSKVLENEHKKVLESHGKTTFGVLYAPCVNEQFVIMS